MKRIVFIALLLLLPSLVSGQAVFPRGLWHCSLAGLVAALTECQAVPTNKADYYVVTDIIVQTTTGTSGSYSVQTGTGTNCGSGTAGLFPANIALTYKAPIAANPTAVITPKTPLVAPAGAAICVIGTGTNTINIELLGFTNR